MQLLQPLLSGYLGGSRRCPLNRGFNVLNWKIFGYFSLHFRWVIHRPVKKAIGNGSEKSYTYSLALHPVLSKGVSHARLPSMWPGFVSWRRRHMWVEFVVGFLPCTKRFFSGYFAFPFSFKTNTFKFQFDLEPTDMFQRVLNNSQVFVGKQITPKKMAPVVETLALSSG